MRATLQTACVVTMALAGLVACRNSNGANADSASGAVPGGAPAESTIAPTPANGTAAAATADTTGSAASNGAADLGTMGDTAILAKADAEDSTEVAVAKFMRMNSKNRAVQSYAAELERDHSKGMGQVERVAKTLTITMKLPPNDTTVQSAQHTLDHLKSLNGHDRDTAFVNHEIQDHQSDIADAKSMLDAAQDPHVKDLLNKELPVLQKHLSDAQTLQSKLSGSTNANQ